MSTNPEIKHTLEEHAYYEVVKTWLHLCRTPSHVHFFKNVVTRTIDAIRNRDFSKFDALTTSNCCHGLATYAVELLFESTNEVDSIELPLLTNSDSIEEMISLLPFHVFHLCNLWVLNYVSETSGQRGRTTKPKKIKIISEDCGTTFCQELVKRLQRQYANLIAQRYSELTNEIPNSFEINGISIQKWAKYCSAPFVKKCKRSILYTSSMFSQQIVLSFLSFRKSKIALLVDYYSHSYELIKRSTEILVGDGSGGFKIDQVENVSENETMVAYGGICICNEDEIYKKQKAIEKLIQNFPLFIHSGEIHYPQFPQVNNDTGFDRSAILPEELEFSILNKISQRNGVSIDDPSLLYINHIFPISGKEITDLQVQYNILAKNIEFSPKKLLKIAKIS